jgi:hypothetical protein
MGNEVVPADTFEWLAAVQEKYGKEVFDLARESISAEKRITAFRRPVASPPPGGG